MGAGGGNALKTRGMKVSRRKIAEPKRITCHSSLSHSHNERETSGKVNMQGPEVVPN